MRIIIFLMLQRFVLHSAFVSIPLLTTVKVNDARDPRAYRAEILQYNNVKATLCFFGVTTSRSLLPGSLSPFNLP